MELAEKYAELAVRADVLTHRLEKVKAEMDETTLILKRILERDTK